MTTRNSYETATELFDLRHLRNNLMLTLKVSFYFSVAFLLARAYIHYKVPAYGVDLFGFVGEVLTFFFSAVGVMTTIDVVVHRTLHMRRIG